MFWSAWSIRRRCIYHDAALTWFRTVAAAEGRATCPLTEDGLIRVVSQLSYPKLRLSPACAAESLALFKAGFPEIHRFWPDGVSLTDHLNVLTGSRQTTDAYLAGLAYRNGGRLATLDGGIRWRLIERIVP